MDPKEYDEDFEKEYVQAIVSKSNGSKKRTDDLRVRKNPLYSWLRKHTLDGGKSTYAAPEKENRALRRVPAKTGMEHAMLKAEARFTSRLTLSAPGKDYLRLPSRNRAIFRFMRV